MAEDGEQTPRTRSRGPGPRPVAALQQDLALQAGFAVRRALPAAEPGGPQADASNNGSLHHTPTSNVGNRPMTRPPIRPPGGGQKPTIHSAAGNPAARSDTDMASRGSNRTGRTSDDWQTDKHLPMGTNGVARRQTQGSASGQFGGAEAAESMAGRYGPRFADEHRLLPRTDHDDFSQEKGDADELVAFEDLPARAPSASIEDDPNRPKGPDYVALRPLILAEANHRDKRRRGWREDKLNLPEEMDAEAREKIIGSARMKAPSPETQKAYLARGRGLLDRFRRETGTRISLEDVDPRQFVNWLLGLKPTLSKNSWRTYRVASAAVLQSIPSEHLDEALGMLHADLYVGDDEGRSVNLDADTEGEEASGAALRAKRMEYVHFQHLRRSLRVMSRSRAVEWMLDWLDAGINTGLRPTEWAITALERRPDRRFRHGERIWLHVVSAKAADGRATHRTLDISNFAAETLGSVERMVERSHNWMLAGKYAQRQAEVARLFRQACKALFPRMKLHYTLYSLRHQFIANMKTIYSREELAAMVDHVLDDTQVEHYAKRRSSWAKEEIKEVPIPVEEQVAQLRKRLELSDLRRSVTAAMKAALVGAAEQPIKDAVGYERGDEDL